MGTAYLILENGAVFRGETFGYDAEAIGELVFSTGMTGYMETLSDPCYSGQIVLQTFPLIGNYGVIPAEFGNGKAHLKAYIVREWCQEPSNFRNEGELDTFLRDNRIPGLCGVDTRAITRVIRENGVMNAMVSKTPELTDEQWSELRSYKITGAVADAGRSYSSASIGVIGSGIEKQGFKVAVWDFGAAQSVILNIAVQGCFGSGTILNHGTATAEELLVNSPDGVILSEGPGDPLDNTRIIEEIKKLCDKNIPILGIGLGHQMLALAKGAKTEKLRFGHRGANQTVRNTRTGRVFVTTQNHGYAVKPDSLPKTAEMIYVNCSDGTCEGIEYSGTPALSVQFRPDAEVIGRFVDMMRGGAGDAAE